MNTKNCFLKSALIFLFTVCIISPLHPQSVGTPAGTSSVSNQGAAQYHISIECPDGGPLMPQVSIDYSSQSGNGLVGYGFSINGLQCITRGGKDLFHDNVKNGVKYNADDALFLNGTRLILNSGTAGSDGATYTPEGNPYTTVTLHGSASSTSCWFSVITNDGLVYEIGNTTDSRLSFVDQKRATHVAAWYVNKVTDSHTNYMTYAYTASNYTVRPIKIDYGMSESGNHGIVNSVAFNYAGLPAASVTCFAIGDRLGKIDSYLTSIVTKSGNNVYRTYDFTYNSTSDATQLKHYRLTQVDMKNGAGEKVAPTKIEWNYLTAPALQSKELTVPTIETHNSGYVEKSKNFFASDVNGDGVSDIIRLSFIDNQVLGRHVGAFYRVYVNRSLVSSSGPVTFENEPCYFDITDVDETGIIMQDPDGCTVMDIDADGLNDLVFPFHYYVEKDINYARCFVVFGKDMKSGRSGTAQKFDVQLHTSSLPLYTSFDVNGDGKDNLIFLERKKVGNTYPCVLVEVNKKSTPFTMNLAKEPQKLFSGDYNNDGLTDLIVLYDGGYKIYFNNGGAVDAAKFTENNTKTSANSSSSWRVTLSDNWRVKQGDIDGDGLLDFVYNKKGESCLHIARNKGDGTFDISTTENIDVKEDTDTKYDNDKFSINVWDMDHDGRSDVLVCKSCYHSHTIGAATYKDTKIVQLDSDGTTLKLKNTITKHRAEDALERYIFQGDFDGDGQMELANYGSNLLSTDDTFKEKINVYKSGTDLSQQGKVSKVTDGLGNYTTFKYAYATNPSVYTNIGVSIYPVNSYTLPISVVSSTTSSRGAAGAETIQYHYEDLLLHLSGKGNLGFGGMTKENTTLGTKETTRVEDWDKTRWVPTKTKTINTVGGATSTVITTSEIAKVGNNYSPNRRKTEIKDLDGNVASTTTNYDTAKGVVILESANNDSDGGNDGMYKMVTYANYKKTGNRWLPGKITTIQKHADSHEEYKTETVYTYNDKGDMLTSTEFCGTPMALKTENTYDVYGNVLSSVNRGTGVKAITKQMQYDCLGRVTKAYTTPATTVTTYTYDIWGNLLTECDETDTSNKLLTTYMYDSWGRLKSKTIPEGLQTYYTTGWASGNNKKYYTKETGAGRPPLTIYYDAAGRELQRVTKGLKDVDVTKTTTYNKQGQVSRVKNVTGKLTVTNSYTYDARGRLTKETSSTGKSTTYAYANRTTTTTTAGRTYTKTIDAWGNVTSVKDPQNTVTYRYLSNGKPASVTTNGNTITMMYDEAGHQTRLIDPDAGENTYTYATDGTLLSQTDNRGVQTNFIYDRFGRLVIKNVGQSSIQYTYGRGSNKFLLASEAMDDKQVEYTYDKYGRVLTEKRIVGDKGTYTFTYAYNANSQLSKTTYPGGLEVTFQYDANGFKTQTKAGSTVVFQQESYDGLVNTISCMGTLTSTTVLNNRGLLQSKQIATYRDPVVLDKIDFQYEASTGNLLSRQRMGQGKETFTYDNLDRLTSVKVGDKQTLQMEYSKAGNIEYKKGIGNYLYNDSFHPHAVTEVENEDGLVSSDRLETTFNDFGKIDRISKEAYRNNTDMTFEYGPDGERWCSRLSNYPRYDKTFVYAGNYEKMTSGGSVKEFYYLDGNTIIIRENGKFKNFLAFTDNIGSILSVIDEEAMRVFDASYDAWGRQTLTKNDIGLRRGYTGHEMIPELDIINMNGRLYDPVLGRFLSPDNYVQLPENSQSFNRYSYCLNNPLKYNDPSGELFGIDDAVLCFAFFNMASSMMTAAFNGDNVWKAGALSLLSSAAAYGIGQAFGNVGSVGAEFLRAGAHGLSSGVFSAMEGQSFVSGFISGATSSGIGSFAQGVNMNSGLMVVSSSAMGGVSAWATGGDFLQGAFNGMQIAMLNHNEHWESTCSDGSSLGLDYDSETGEMAIEVRKSYGLSLSSAIGLEASAFEGMAKQWKGMKTSTKSRWVYNAKKYINQHTPQSMQIKSKPSTLYRVKIPSALNGAAKTLTKGAFFANVAENASYVYTHQRVGLGNAVDMAVAGLAFTGWGTPISLSYMAADFMTYYITGYNIRDHLNNVASYSWR